jgi:hypothetical protein
VKPSRVRPYVSPRAGDRADRGPRPSSGPPSGRGVEPCRASAKKRSAIDHRPDADESEAVSHERPKVAGARVRYPILRKAILAQQGQHLAGIATIGLRLTDHRGPNLRGITDAQRVTQLVHELVKPRRIAGALDPDCHRSAQAAVELLHLVATMLEPTLSHLAGLSVSSTAML